MNDIIELDAGEALVLSILRMALGMLLLLAPGLASGQVYSDSYPKNPGIDIESYVFHLTFTADSDFFEGATVVTARYLTEGQRTLRLDLIEQSDDLEGKGMLVSDVMWDGTPLSFEHRDNQIFIDLGRELDAGELAEVTVAYSGRPATGLKIGPNKYGDWTWFSDNWSSRVRNWLPVVDHPSDKATTEMIVTAPGRYQVASNGTIVEESDLGDGNRRTHYVNPIPTATWLYFVGVAQFAIERVDTFEGVPIETWVYWQDRERGFYDFAEPSKKVLAYYTDLIGPYVNDRLANVVSNATGGGMEAASTPAYSDRSVSGQRTARWQHVIIHEIAHQWFGNAVTEYHWNDVWLSEGFATYYTLLFRRHLYGHDNFISGLKQSRQTVTDFYDRPENYDFQLVRDYIEDLNRVSGAMMYQKGAWVLHLLREQLGHDVYDEAIRAYYAEFVNRNAQSADLRRHLEEASGEDLEQFFKQWLFQGGVPELEFSWNQSGEVFRVTTVQIQRDFDFELTAEVLVRFDDGSSEVITVPVGGKGDPATTTRDFDQPVAEVVVDPNTRLLAKWTVADN